MDADNVKADRSIALAISAGQLTGQGHQSAMFRPVHMDFRRQTVAVLGAGFHLDDRDRASVGRLGHDVDLAKPIVDVAAEEAVSLAPKITGDASLALLSALHFSAAPTHDHPPKAVDPWSAASTPGMDTIGHWSIT